MLRKSNRRIALVVAVVVAAVIASFATFVAPAYAATITASPTSGTVTVAASGTNPIATLVTSGNTMPVTFTQLTGGPSLNVNPSTGAIMTSGILAAGSYTATGNMTDLPATDTGTFSFTLTVTPGTITQILPTTGTVGFSGSSSFSAQLLTSGGFGTVTFARTGGSAKLSVSGSGLVTTVGGPLRAGSYSVNGTDTDTLGNTGTFNFTLTVTAELPGPPIIQTATAGNNSAKVRWAPPVSDGGSAITGYLITPSVGSPVLVPAGTNFTVTGLNDGTAYTFTVAAMNVAGTGPASAPSNSVTPTPTGYWLVASDGGIFSFGQNLFYGSTGGIHLNQPIVGMASTPDGLGYWLVASDGGIFSYGDANFYGSTGGIHLNQPIVGMASTATGNGYWMVASDGGIFTFGDARFHGSTGGKHLNKPIVGMAATPQGAGYWLVASDGGIFTFGTSGFYGSAGGTPLNKPIVGMSTTSSGKGYWLVASDGGIFAYGDAGFYGSTGSKALNKPIVGMDTSPKGKGYWLVASDGGIFAYGDAAFFGSTGGMSLNQPIVGMG